ncbi:MAG: RNA ligase (ATP) [Planctomycetota bacterium]
MERKLVSIQRIDAIESIADADAIVKARVMGWDVVVKKGEFAVDDPCVFFEIDSVLPDGAPWAEFMRPRGFRVKTIRLRGVLSQGLALPVAILDEGVVPAIGADVREQLGVHKYEPPVPLNTGAVGPFPSRVPKTDEIRLQSALGVLEEIRGQEFVVTTKLDGTSLTFFMDEEGVFHAASRNWSLLRGDTAPWKIAERYRLEEKLPRGMAVQGELCGPGIQKNRLDLRAIDWFVFDAYDVGGRRRYLEHRELLEFCANYDLRTVPIETLVAGDDARSFEHSLERWLELARGEYDGTKNRKEGIVVRPLHVRHSEVLGGRLSFKVINNDFLLKDED